MTAILPEVRKMVDQLVHGEDEIAKWLEKNRSTISQVERLPGDASTRRYFRLFSGNESYIVMKAEPFTDQGSAWPFLAVQKHLARSGVDVPRVLDFDSERGYVLLEDLGDVTLLRSLQDVSNPEREREIYERVINQLVDLHLRASAPHPGDQRLEAFNLKFDHEKLFWEVQFTFEHFYDGYLKRNMTESDRRLMLSRLSEICQILADEPTVFTHRDYHSRNIMVAPASEGEQERLVMIDFQDARMGPAQYDLASLLRDSYYQLDEAQIRKLVDYYIARWAALSGATLDRNHFFKVFDLMSVQRNFKAIGSFASFMNRRGNPGYLKYIGNTFENIRRTLLRYPEYSDLREALFHYYYF